MFTLKSRAPSASLTAEDWEIICMRASRAQFMVIQVMRAGDRHDAAAFAAYAQWRDEKKRSSAHVSAGKSLATVSDGGFPIESEACRRTSSAAGTARQVAFIRASDHKKA